VDDVLDLDEHEHVQVQLQVQVQVGHEDDAGERQPQKGVKRSGACRENRMPMRDGIRNADGNARHASCCFSAEILPGYQSHRTLPTRQSGGQRPAMRRAT
jgi:hypothetical protein